MTEDIEVVITGPLERTNLPVWLGMGVSFLLHLEQRGVWKELAERLRVQRAGGYVGIDAVLVLLLFFCSGPGWGIKAFANRASTHGRALAALGGRKSLPTQSAISRLLGAMEMTHVRAVGTWMLWEASGAARIAGHSAMMSFDARGERWHIVDYDLTKTVLRKRGLPEGEDLPPPKRHTDGFAEPGYRGHKRGEVQVSRATLQHAGSGLWLDARVHPGNGDGLESLASAIAASAHLAETLGHPRERVLMRLDGEFGGLPALSLLHNAGQPAVTRLNRLKLLDQPEVQERIRTGTWYIVPDSGAGPVRSAMDLGVVTLVPGRDTRRPDGTPYEPIEVRVVISRYPREGEAEHGRVIDGWQYELFALVHMPVEAWPAHESVSTFFGRGGQENRFAQEDRELKLDRIFSYNLAGQELACLVGLMVWNLQIVNGVALERPLPERRPAPLAAPIIDDRPVPAPTGSSEASVDPAAVESQVPADPAEALAEVLAEVDWTFQLRTRNAWSWDADARMLRCPAGEPTTVTHVQPNPGAANKRTMFRAPLSACRTCLLRSGCFGSLHPDKPKIATISLPSGIADRLADLLPAVTLARRKHLSAKAMAAPPKPERPKRRLAGTPLAIAIDTGATRPGSRQVSHARFLPAPARQASRRAFEKVDIQVTLRQAIPRPEHPFIGSTPERRQHRRATWAQRLAWYALPDGSTVHVAVHGGENLPWVRQTSGDTVSAKSQAESTNKLRST